MLAFFFQIGPRSPKNERHTTGALFPTRGLGLCCRVSVGLRGTPALPALGLCAHRSADTPGAGLGVARKQARVGPLGSTPGQRC